MTKLETFQCYFVTKLYPLKPSPFLKVKMSKSYLLRGRLAQLETFRRGSSKSRGQQHAKKGSACPRGAACPEGSAKLGGAACTGGEA